MNHSPQSDRIISWGEKQEQDQIIYKFIRHWHLSFFSWSSLQVPQKDTDFLFASRCFVDLGFFAPCLLLWSYWKGPIRKAPSSWSCMLHKAALVSMVYMLQKSFPLTAVLPLSSAADDPNDWMNPYAPQLFPPNLIIMMMVNKVTVQSCTKHGAMLVPAAFVHKSESPKWEQITLTVLRGDITYTVEFGQQKCPQFLVQTQRTGDEKEDGRAPDALGAGSKAFLWEHSKLGASRGEPGSSVSC